MLPIEKAASDKTHLVQFFYRDNIFMGSDLKDAIRTGINNWFSGLDMLCGILLNDHRSRGLLIPQDALTNLLRESLEDLDWKALRISRELLPQDEAGKLPMAGGSGLLIIHLVHLSIGPPGVLYRRNALNIYDIPYA